ncbi:vomeronasal type-2 receptor 26-like [Dendropsophus ebraccatus]|uniref:vomeronasal type-2 receptor 26-like n=1 Tax=Dendropsophus ebraccatus TaxID=150705 RepID=UPI0038316490
MLAHVTSSSECPKTRTSAKLGRACSLISTVKVIWFSQPMNISYGESLNNKLSFPFFYYTAHGPNTVNKAIVKLLKYFGWTWIGIVTVNVDDLLKATENLMEEVYKNGICVEYSYIIPENVVEINKRFLNLTNSRVLILNIPIQSCEFVLKIMLRNPKHLIFTKDILSDQCLLDDRYSFMLDEVLFFVPRRGNIIGLKEVLQGANPVLYPKNKILENVWLSYFNCVPPDKYYSEIYWCGKNFTLANLPNTMHDVENLRTTYSVYLAVYAVAHSLHNMYMANYKRGKNPGSFIQRIYPKPLNKFLRNLHFQTPSGDDIIFDEMGISDTRLELLHVVVFPNKTYAKEPVGEYIPNANGSDRFVIRKGYVQWEERNRKVKERVHHPSNGPPKPPHSLPSMTTYSTDFRNKAVYPTTPSQNIYKKVQAGLFQDLLGTLFTSLIVILYVCSFIVLVIFIRYRETPIVKNNNRNLSYTILISLMLCFLCSLLFIGNPAKLTCLLQNIIFNLVFVVAVSSILTKTITVLMAFNVTKPNNRIRKCFRKISHVFIVFCFIGEFSICIYWIHFYSPYPDRDSVSKPGILILHCNVGSQVIFYLALGYNSFLALLCFLVAYFAKKLPDRFNEAHHITFSMLVFCSVWISFIPAYISTRGRYMTAVQVFAILASSAGLLGFIFFPKCFIIIFRPELNAPGTSAFQPTPTPSPPLCSTPSSKLSKRSIQLSLQQSFEWKRKYTATHQQAEALNVHIGKLLSLEMLPYRLVETEALRNLMAVAAPRSSTVSGLIFGRFHACLILRLIFSTLITAEERSMRVNQYQQALVQMLKCYFPSNSTSARGRSFVGQKVEELVKRQGNTLQGL